MIRALRIGVLAIWCLAGAAWADPIRIASFNAELVREGPGLLLRDLRRGGDAQIDAVVAVIADTRPDILVLQGIDFDHDLQALAALNDRLTQGGAGYDHLFARPTNRGLDSGHDLDGDGRLGGAADAEGFGRFYGQGAMAILSRHPILTDAMRDFTDLPWSALPGAEPPLRADGSVFPSEAAWRARRLSSSGHWVVPVQTPGGVLHVLAYHAGPPVFDGPEDANGLRNRDETLFWRHLLDGAMGPAPMPPFVIAGSANLDPDRSDGRREAMRALLSDPRLQDPAPMGASGRDTVDWPRVGRLRVDYVLPSADLTVTASGVYWPDDSARVAAASRHRLVWVDIALP